MGENSDLTSSARDPAGGGRAPGVVQHVPVRIEEVVIGAGEGARGARLHGLVPFGTRGEIRTPARGSFALRIKYPLE